jgi:MFS family permease
MAAISTLIIAISIFQLANGFFGTLVSLRVSVEEFSVPLGGLILSSYYAGYTVGAVRCGRIIERIGHIRAFAVFAGLTASAVAAMPAAVSAILWIIFMAALFLGGFMSTIYPVGVAHSHDLMPDEQIVAVSGRLILLHGTGASLGSLIGSVLMRSYDIDGVFYFMAAIAAVLVIVASYRCFKVKEIPHEPRPFDVLSPQATSLSHSYKEQAVEK